MTLKHVTRQSLPVHILDIFVVVTLPYCSWHWRYLRETDRANLTNTMWTMLWGVAWRQLQPPKGWMTPCRHNYRMQTVTCLICIETWTHRTDMQHMVLCVLTLRDRDKHHRCDVWTMNATPGWSVNETKGSLGLYWVYLKASLYKTPNDAAFSFLFWMRCWAHSQLA